MQQSSRILVLALTQRLPVGTTPVTGTHLYTHTQGRASSVVVAGDDALPWTPSGGLSPGPSTLLPSVQHVGLVVATHRS